VWKPVEKHPSGYASIKINQFYILVYQRFKKYFLFFSAWHHSLAQACGTVYEILITSLKTM
jgi:hypothetical protein